MSKKRTRQHPAPDQMKQQLHLDGKEGLQLPRNFPLIRFQQNSTRRKRGASRRSKSLEGTTTAPIRSSSGNPWWSRDAKPWWQQHRQPCLPQPP